MGGIVCWWSDTVELDRYAWASLNKVTCQLIFFWLLIEFQNFYYTLKCFSQNQGYNKGGGLVVVWGARVRDGSWVPPILRWPTHSNLWEDRLRQSTWNEDWRINFHLFIIINFHPWICWPMSCWMQYNCLHPGQISVAFQSRVERVRWMSPPSRHHEAVRLYEERGHRYQDPLVLLNNRLDGHLSKEGRKIAFQTMSMSHPTLDEICSRMPICSQ